MLHDSSAIPKLSDHRGSSRTDSASSSVKAILQRATSLPPRPRSRSTALRPETPGPNDRTDDGKSPALHTSMTAGPSRPPQRSNSGNSARSLANVNRWSRSTISSKAASPQSTSRRQGSFSRRTSFGVASSPNGSGSQLGHVSSSQLSSTKGVQGSASATPSNTTKIILPEIVNFAALTDPITAPKIGRLPTLSVDTVPSASSSFVSDPSDITPKKVDLQRALDESDIGIDLSKRILMSQTDRDSPLLLSTWDPPPQQYEEPEIATNSGMDSSSPSQHPRAPADGDIVGATPVVILSREADRQNRQRGPSQKSMLSKALQKANTAVLLDNAANFEGAIEAYVDACQLLQQAMLRSSGGNDERHKLQEIRNTYMIRVDELRRQDVPSQQPNDKALPERPLSDESLTGEAFHLFDEDEDDDAIIETATAQRIIDNPLRVAELMPPDFPERRQSLLSAVKKGARVRPASGMSLRPFDRSLPNSSGEEVLSDHPDHSLNLAPINSVDYMPPPLSPRRPSPLDQPYEQASDAIPVAPPDSGNETTSWLDTIDESTASSPSSTPSRSSAIYLRSRYSRRASNGTEAAFDAALDAAVEAAYDQGLEPVSEISDGFFDDSIVTNARRNIEIAKQRVREAEREAQVAMTRGQENRRIQQEVIFGQPEPIDSGYVDDEAEEEERLLEEMTRGYVVDEPNFGLPSKSALPRQSDSSGFSGRTWGSSVASNTNTTGTSLSCLAEGIVLPSFGPKVQPKRTLPPPPPMPSSSPPAPPGPPPSFSNPGPATNQSVRTRRLSGRSLTQLKIETSCMPQAPKTEPLPALLSKTPPPLPVDNPPLPPKNASNVPPRPVQSGLASRREGSLDSLTSDTQIPGLVDSRTQDGEDMDRSSPSRPVGKVSSAPGALRKNMSSSSLKALRGRNMSISAPDISTDSPTTPSSSTFPPNIDLHKGITSGIVPTLPTPTAASFTGNGLPSGGFYLFDNDIHSPISPGSPNTMATNPPIPLEPCPDSYLLRPFWLMRCLYQTIAHPRGGYLSTKLFVPRDIWRVKNVRIKAVDEKVSHCDLLTAALLKLAQVDTYDADAVLEEMQSFENVLDQVQASLTKKLGSEVGVHGAMSLLKSTAPEDGVTSTDAPSGRISSGAGKSYWRKLRSKTSGFASPAQHQGIRDSSKYNYTMNSLPMTTTPDTRIAKRNVTDLQFTGPNAHYMGALARLFDAVQVLDQIARQVEDPGLRHSSQTLVGLELSARHAAEFFGFYVCRFALNDVGMMLDKYIKRGSEWVLT